MPHPSAPDDQPPRIRYLRTPVPLHFPIEEPAPVSKLHWKLRLLLFEILRDNFAHTANIGCNQFVYWNAADPKRNLAPDAFIRLGTPDTLFDCWKTWERGAPELAVEIVSERDSSDSPWETKLHRYHELGIGELVRFEPHASAAEQLRVWDRVEEDLLERVVEGPGRSPCLTLNLHWVVVPDEDLPASLRLSRDPDGTDLLPTPAEQSVLARKAAEERIAELEEALRRRDEKP